LIENTTCRYCTVDKEAARLEQTLHCDGIWLHALQYSGSDWKFRTSVPAWAMTLSKEVDGMLAHIDSTVLINTKTTINEVSDAK
jgi:hypothetical protein